MNPGQKQPLSADNQENTSPDEHTTSSGMVQSRLRSWLPTKAEAPPEAAQLQPPKQPLPSDHEARQERLRQLRQQRQLSARLPSPSQFQRKGIPPTPPPRQSFGELIKFWWENGPFAAPIERQQTPISTPKIPNGIGASRPLETHARAWIARGKKEAPILFAQARKYLATEWSRLQRALDKKIDRPPDGERTP